MVFCYFCGGSNLFVHPVFESYSNHVCHIMPCKTKKATEYLNNIKNLGKCSPPEINENILYSTISVSCS